MQQWIIAPVMLMIAATLVRMATDDSAIAMSRAWPNQHARAESVRLASGEDTGRSLV